VVAERLVEVETLLTRRVGSRRIEKLLAERWSLTTRQVRHYIARVRRTWEAEASSEGREAKRDAMRASLDDLYANAMGRTEIVRDAKGSPILDPQGKPLVRPNPDTKTAVRAAAEIIRLDGLAAPTKVEVSGAVRGAAAPPNPKDFFAGRSDAELEFLIQYRRWPRPGELPSGTSSPLDS
jgi:hypothetical protein